jgi:hypothetical protein
MISCWRQRRQDPEDRGEANRRKTIQKQGISPPCGILKDQPSGWSFFQKYDFLKNYIVKNHNNTAYFNKYF